MKAQAALLGDALTAAELDVESIDIENGNPPEPRRAQARIAAGTLFDSKG